MSQQLAWVKDKWQSWINQRIPPTNRIRLTQRNIFIVPSRTGWGFLVLILLLLLTAVNYKNSLIYALTFWLLSMGLATMWLTFRNLSGLVLSSGHAHSCFAGEELNLPVQLLNSKRWSAGLLMAYKQNTPQICNVPPNQAITLNIPFKTSVRGRLEAPRLKVETRYPFGLFTAWTWTALDFQLVIYPAKEASAISLSSGEDGEQLASQTAQTGNDGDFSGIRDYRPGDNLQRIAWKQSARTDNLKTLEMEVEQGVSCWLRWESLAGLDNEKRLSCLASWVEQAEQQGWRYGLSIPGRELAPDFGEKHYIDCLTALALWGKNNSNGSQGA